jgi:hypothetical protein
MSNTFICAQGHALLPLSIKVVKSNLLPDTYYVITRISGSSVGEDRIARSESEARKRADFDFELWTDRLMPVFEAGVMYNKVERAG